MLANIGNKTVMAITSKADKKPSPRRETRTPSAGKHTGQLNAANHTPKVPILSSWNFILVHLYLKPTQPATFCEVEVVLGGEFD